MAQRHPQYASLTDVVHAIRSSGRLTVFLGAGVSRTAGIPLAGEIVLSLGERLRKEGATGADTEENLQQWLERQPFYDKDEPYASVLDATFPNPAERAGYFETLMGEARPGKAHLALAALMQHGVIPCVLTTNFDRLMEYAIVRVCRQMPCVLLFDETPTYVDMRSARPKVFKLHGDYLFGNIRNLGHELYLVKDSTSKKIGLAVREGTLVVAGYGGGDQSVMEVLRDLAKRKEAFPGGVYWLTLEGRIPNDRVLDFLDTAADRGSRILEIRDGDAFFAELARSLQLPSESQGPRLAPNAHLTPLRDAGRESFVCDRLSGLAAQEFLVLLRKFRPFSGVLNSEAAADYLMARFEECGEIPQNLGELVDRYVDLVIGGSGDDRRLTHNRDGKSSKAMKRLAELVQTGLVPAEQARAEITDACLRSYIGALRLLEEGLDQKTLGTMLTDETEYATLCSYVGLLSDATDVVNSAIHQSVDSIILYGRLRPWPDTFYRAAALVGRASRVDNGTVERIADMLCMEFDTEHWYPREAIATLAAMGAGVVEYLAQYMLDSLQDTFSREDAALALGQIGTRRVVDHLSEVSQGLTCRDTKMVVYALGHTGNPRAISVLRHLAASVAEVSDWVLQNALRTLGYACDDIAAGGADEEQDPRPKVDAGSVISGHIPDLEDRSVATIYQRMFTHDPSACAKFVNKKICPPDATKLSRVGVTLLAHDRPWEAEALFVECLDRYPMVDAHYHNVALAYSREGRPLAARRYYAMGLSLDPDYSDYYNDFAVTMMKLNNLEAARYLLVHALIKDFDNYRPWFNLANVNLHESRFVGDPRRDVPPRSVRTGVGLHVEEYEPDWSAALDFGRLRDACVCLRQVLKLNPSHPTAPLMLEQLNLFAQDATDREPAPNELAQVLHIGEAIIPDSVHLDDLPREANEAWQRSANQLYQGDLTSAIAAMEEVLRLYRRSPDVYLNLGVLYVTARVLDKAIVCLQEGLRKWPSDHHLLLNYCDCMLRANCPKDAVAAAEKAIRVRPQDAASWFGLAKALRANGQIGEARAASQEAIRFAPRWSLLEARAKDLLAEIAEIRESHSPRSRGP